MAKIFSPSLPLFNKFPWSWCCPQPWAIINSVLRSSLLSYFVSNMSDYALRSLCSNAGIVTWPLTRNVNSFYPYLLEQSSIQDRLPVLFTYHKSFPPEMMSLCINYTLVVLSSLWTSMTKGENSSETRFLKSVLCTLLM